METHVTKAVVSPDGNIINETRPVIVNEVGADNGILRLHVRYA